MIHAGLCSSDSRVFPGTVSKPRPSFALEAVRGEKRSCQLYVENSGSDTIVKIGSEPSPGIDVRVRRVGSVPVPRHNTDTPESDLDGRNHIPGMVPDILFDETEQFVPSGGSGLFWITLIIDRKAAAGSHDIPLRVAAGTTEIVLNIDIEVFDVNLQPRTGLSVTHWFYSDALLDWYGLDGFNDRYWELLPAYIENLMSHGNDTLYVPLFTPTTDGDRRPAQLLSISESFDWSAVSRYLQLAKQAGFRKFEWPHLFSQWGAGNAIRMYEGQGTSGKLLWPDGTSATSDRYRGFLTRFLPEFKSFLDREEIFDGSYFHISDEPHGEEHKTNYIASRNMIRDLAPWMKTMDAVSEIEYGRENLTDIPIPQLGTAMDYVNEGIHCFTYFCCHPRFRYINRLLDTPLHKIRMLGWVLYRRREFIHGFLHWGYNYWYKSQTRDLIDPYNVTDAENWPGWAYGDPFVVYPGEHGPVDSIRWEAFAEGMAEYQLLETLDVDPEQLQSVEDFSNFPRNPAWRTNARRKALELSGL